MLCGWGRTLSFVVLSLGLASCCWVLHRVLALIWVLLQKQGTVLIGCLGEWLLQEDFQVMLTNNVEIKVRSLKDFRWVPNLKQSARTKRLESLGLTPTSEQAAMFLTTNYSCRTNGNPGKLACEPGSSGIHLPSGPVCAFL